MLLRNKITRKKFAILALLCCITISSIAQEIIPIYKDASKPIEERVADLLSKMTLQEKIAQLSHLHGHQRRHELRMRRRIQPYR